jgi:hypothetical protein
MKTPLFCEDKNWINLIEWLHIIRRKWEDVFTIQLYFHGGDFKWCIIFIKKHKKYIWENLKKSSSTNGNMKQISKNTVKAYI